MQVMLVKDVERTGKKGETKKVTEGYARNYLFPRSLAVPITEGTMNNLKLLQSSWKRQEIKEKEEALNIAKKIEGVSIRITKKSGEKGRLFGSVTTSELAELISSQTSMAIDKKSIITEPIKELGQHEVVVKLSGEVKATVKVVVLPEEATATQ